MRHTFASHKVMSGADIVKVEGLPERSDLKTTTKYAHLAPNHKQAAMRNLGRYLVASDEESETKEVKKN